MPGSSELLVHPVGEKGIYKLLKCGPVPMREFLGANHTSASDEDDGELKVRPVPELD